jgi:hypothetical protein
LPVAPSEGYTPPQAEGEVSEQGAIAREDKEVQSSEVLLTISTGTVLSVASSKSEEVDTSLVKVLVSYPEGYTGGRYMTDGQEYSVSLETANLFIEKGIATKVD